MLPPARITLIACMAVLPLGAQFLDEKTDLAVPLTAQGKASRALEIIVSPGPAFGALMGATFDHLDNDPREWGQGAKGYGRRFISLYGRYSTATMLRAGLDAAMKTDPRYDRCDCTATGLRAGHAIKRLFLTRKDSGGETVNVPVLAGLFGAAAIAGQWNPDRLNTVGHHFEVGAIGLGFAGATNVLREFWPDIKEKIPFLKK